MSRWTHEEELKLLLIIVNQTNPKIDWVDVASKIGRTKSSISQHYEGIKKKASLELSIPLPPAAKRHRSVAKESQKGSKVKAESSDRIGESDDVESPSVGRAKRAHVAVDEGPRAKKMKISVEEEEEEAELSWLATIATVKPEDMEP